MVMTVMEVMEAPHPAVAKTGPRADGPLEDMHETNERTRVIIMRRLHPRQGIDR